MDIGQIQDVTDSLALMPDAALQKYAMMNKDDPYIMSLAMSENNRRQKLRTAQQGQAGQMPAPKVVDQVIQSINPPPAPPPQAQQPMPPQQAMPQAQAQLPEQQGIAQLPAPNMQGMADGGIAGYADGGDVEYKYVRDASGRVVKVPVDKAEKKPGLSDLMQKMSDYSNRNANNPAAMAPTALAQPLASPTPDILKTANQQGFMPGGSTPPQVTPSDTLQAPPPPPAEKRPAAKTDSGLQSLLKTGAGTSTSQAGAPETDPTKLAAEYAKIRDAYTPQNRFGKEIGELTAAERAALEQEKAEAVADIAKRGPAMAGYETRLKGREERLSKQEADLPAMSIIEAGLAIMSGTSPNALANIGAGAQTGVKSYKSGLDKLTEARDKLDDSFSRIEELRRSEGMANDKELRQMSKGIAQTYTKAKEMGLSALMEDGKLGRKEAETAFTTMASNRKAIYEQGEQTKRTGMEQAGANARSAFSAQIQKEIAAMPGATERLYFTLGGGDVKKGFDYLTAATAEGKGDEAIMQAVIKSPEILGAISPEVRKVVEQKIMERFTPAPQSKPTGTAFK